MDVTADSLSPQQVEDGAVYDDRHSSDVDYLALFQTQAGQHAAIRDLLAPTPAAEVTCRDASCQAATSHVETCDCRCGGDGHGLDHRTSRAAAVAAARARTERAGGVMAQLAAMGGLGDSDDGWWNETPAAVPAQRRELPDFDDPCWD